MTDNYNYSSKEPKELKLYLTLPVGAMILGDFLGGLGGMGLDGIFEFEDPEVLVLKVTRRAG